MKILIYILLFTSFEVMGQISGPHYFDDPSGNTREYFLYIPENLPQLSPLVYSLHAWGDSALSMMSYGSFNNLAEIHKFLVCYPTALIDGDGGSSGLTSWNTNGMSDVDFIMALNQELINEYEIDEKKVFSTGFSYGAEMSHHLARCQNTKVFLAIAPVGGAIFDYMDVCSPTIKTSVFILHGTNDNTIYYDGGYFEGYGPYVSASDATSSWVNFNSCIPYESYIIPNSSTTSGSIEVDKYVNIDDNIHVWFYSIIDLDHYWPTTNNSQINASEEIWSFFKNIMDNQNLSTSEIDNKNKILIKVINILGQEVNPKNQLSGTLLYYIYNNEIIEKKIVKQFN